MPTHEAELRLRTVQYIRYHGPWHEPEAVQNSLLVFVYDIPYFGLCGIFPPFRLLNQELRRGGSTGGMSPGATWEPFELLLEEYSDLVEAIRVVPVESLRDRTRYAHLPFAFDPAFDGPPETYPVHWKPKRRRPEIPDDYKDYVEWYGAIWVKHRERWRAEMKRAGFMS